MQVLELNNISKVYKDKTVLDDISLTVNQGEIIGLLGPNGAGKTTMMKIISGLTLPNKGEIKILGIDALNHRDKIKADLGFIMQENNMEREFTVYEALLSYARLYKLSSPKQAVLKMIEQFSMQEWQNRKIDRLSGGMARKVMIARALLATPKLLLMDEPSVGLDPDVRIDIWQEIRNLRKHGISVIITTHYMEEAETLCDKIAILKSGKIIVMDTVENLKQLIAKDNDENLTLEKAFLRFIGKEVHELV